MIGFSHSLSAVLNDRAEHLRDVAARETVTNAARRAEKAAVRARRRQEAARDAAHEQQLALFSWQTNSAQRREGRRDVGRHVVGRAR